MGSMAGEKKKLNVGVIGYGFMGRTHSNAFGKVNQFFDLKREPVLKAVCGRDEQKVQAFAKNWNYESSETDWRKLVSRKDIDLIDIASPNDTHAEIAVAAAEAGKMVMCEKPLGRNEAEAAKMVAAVEKVNVPNMVWYNYRRVPAVTLAKHLIDEGRLGKIYHYRAKFLQDWTISKDLPQGGAALWRLEASVAGSGVTGDLLAHCIDTAMWLNGSIDKVTAVTETFVKERSHNLTGKVEPVSIDDACLFLARFANGSLASFEATRYARGHKALYTFEINGEHASIFWDLHDLHRLQYFDHRDEGIVRGWRSLHITDSDHPYMKHWWVPGLLRHGSGDRRSVALGYFRSVGATVTQSRRKRVGAKSKTEEGEGGYGYEGSGRIVFVGLDEDLWLGPSPGQFEPGGSRGLLFRVVRPEFGRQDLDAAGYFGPRAARRRNYPYWRPGCDERAHSGPRRIDGVSVFRPLSPPQRLQESGVPFGGRRSSPGGDRAARRRDRRDVEAFASASAEAGDTVGRRAAARCAWPLAHPQAEAFASGRTPSSSGCIGSSA